MSIKIGIAGAHSTGKTTVVDAVACELTRLGFRVKRTSDLATAARDHGFPILREHTVASTLWIMARGITLELEAELQADIVLVDRPVPDALGYLVAAFEHRREQVPINEIEYLNALASYHAKTYDNIFKTQIDPSKPVDTSKPRDLDPVFRLSAAKGIDQVFRNLQIDFAPLDIDPDKAREEVLQNSISLLTNKHH